VRPAGGHKTGWFLRPARQPRRVAAFASGRDVLDLFCNAGGFGLACARAGARSVRSVDLDEVVVEPARGARRSSTPSRWRSCTGTRSHVLREVEARGERPGLIVVDPHKLVARKQDLELGMRKYLDLNALAISCARPGGLVATFSCSGLVAEPAFVGVLFQAARRAARGVRLLEQFGAAPDHPQRPTSAARAT
jgi:23S rRNA (cytosine1962-C5)-methyltransferase